MEREVEQLQFLGPAGKTFETFDNQVTYFLDTYCIGWRDYENSSSHLIPPTFEYISAEISDEDVKNLKPGNHKDRIMSNARGQGSEHIVHRAIQKAAHECIAAPFLAIRNLKVDNSSKKILELIFPNIAWQNLEIDFLLIGPKIGLIVIEVKGGIFEDFSKTNVHLPNDYKKGLKQLEIIKTFTAVVAECLKTPPLPVRKIIFTPNLERKRFENWTQNLPSKHQVSLNQQLAMENSKDNNFVKQFFKEDMETGEAENSPLLFQAMKELLEASNSEIPIEVYEANAKFLAGLSSMTAKNGKDVNLQEKKISAACSILMDNIRIGKQNPVREGKQLEKASSHIRISKSGAMKATLEKLQIMYLTPEQLSVLHGDARQMIIGAAGTGKTILLQAKAMQLMSRGEKVLVFAAGPLRWHNKTVFDKEGYTNYEIGDWEYFIRQFVVDSQLELSKKLTLLLHQCISQIVASIVFGEHPSKTNVLYDFLWKKLPEGHLFFDEAAVAAADKQDSCNFLIALLYAKTVREPTSTVWVTWDSVNLSWTEDIGEIMEPLVLSVQHLLGFSLTYLDKVMRSSEEVCKHFQTHFLRAKTMLMPKPPLSGHKIQGIMPIIKEGHFRSEEAAVESMLTELPNILKSIAFHDWPQNSIGISLDGALLKSENCLRLLSLFDTHLSANGTDFLYPLKLTNGQVIYPASIPNLPQKIQPDLTQEKLFWYVQPFIPQQVEYTGSKAPFVIVSLNNIYSLEWPVVISLSIFPRSTYQAYFDQGRYMNRSRAKITFIELFFTYDIVLLVLCGCSLCQNFETKASTLNQTKNFVSTQLGSFFKFGCGKLNLTMEQMEILQGAKRQIIIGEVSTGKTTVLQMKAIELLEKGEKLVVFAPLLLRQQYKWIFDSCGFKNYILFSWSAFMQEVRKTHGTANDKIMNDWLWEIIGMTRNGLHCSSSNCLYSILRKELHDRHVFFDEVFDDNTIFGSWDKAHALILVALAAREYSFELYIWFACGRSTRLPPMFKYYGKYFCFSLSYLNGMKNMSEGVHKALKSSKLTYFFDRILQTSSSPVIYNLHFYEEDAIEHLLTKGFCTVLENFVGEPCSGTDSQIGVLVVGKILWQRDTLEKIVENAEMVWPAVKTGVISPIAMDEQDRYYFMQKYWAHETTHNYFCGRLSSDSVLGKWPEIVLCSTEDATSIRWSRIIILSVIPTSDPATRHYHYITRSRAIENFAELTYTYGSDKTIIN